MKPWWQRVPSQEETSRVRRMAHALMQPANHVVPVSSTKVHIRAGVKTALAYESSTALSMSVKSSLSSS